VKTTKRKVGTFQHSNHPILGGKAKIFRVPKSGDIYQFQMWIEAEKKYLRKTLKTKDLETAILRAEKLCMDTYTGISIGKKIFGITIKELLEKYLEHREKEVGSGHITLNRYRAIKSGSKHFLNYKGHNTKVSELDRNSCYEYEVYRVTTFPNTRKMTIRNERHAINAIMKYGYRQGYCHFDSFDFRKMVIKGKEVSRRNTFTNEEYDQLVRYMRTYVSKRECPDDHERLERLMVRDAILIASNTMLRVGELWNLRWKDILSIEKIFDEDEKIMSLVTINVRGEISKTGSPRRIPVRGGEYIERMRGRSIHTSSDDYIFCSVGKRTKPPAMFWYNHWRQLMIGIGISDYKERKITWYSLRHFGITCRIRSGALLSNIAKLAGTSSHLVEITYGHWDDKILRDTSMKNFSISPNGISIKD
jgi:integrase